MPEVLQGKGALTRKLDVFSRDAVFLDVICVPRGPLLLQQGLWFKAAIENIERWGEDTIAKLRK